MAVAFAFPVWLSLPSLSALSFSIYSVVTAVGLYVGRFIWHQILGRKRGRRMSAMTRMMTESGFPAEAGMQTYVISCALFMKKLPSDEALKEMAKHQLLPFKRLRSLPRGWYWEEVEVHLENHISRTRVKDPSDMLGHIQDVINSPLDDTKPLWQFALLENEKRHPSNSDERPHVFDTDYVNNGAYDVCIFRVEHCVGDGVALVEVLSKILTGKDGAPLAENATLVGLTRKSTLRERRMGRRQRRLNATPVRKGLIDLVRVISWLKHKVLGVAMKLAMAMPCAVSSVLGPYDSETACSPSLEKKMNGIRYSKKQVVGLSGPLSLEFVKKAKRALNVSLNDVMLSCFGGAIRRYNTYFQNPSYGESDPPVRCNALVPFAFMRPASSFSTDESALRNDWVPISVPICTNEPTPLLRVKATNKETAKIKYRMQPLANYLALRVTSSFSLSLARQMAWDSNSRHSFIFANVPGPPRKSYLCGLEIDGIQTLFANLIPQVEILSYNGRVFFNVVSNPHVISAPGKLAGYFVEELRQMGKSAGVEGDVYFTCEEDQIDIDDNEYSSSSHSSLTDHQDCGSGEELDENSKQNNLPHM